MGQGCVLLLAVAAAPMCAFQGAIPQRRLVIGSLEVRRPVGRQDAEAAHDLMEWLRGRGANLDGVTLRKSPLGARAGLGVVATEPLESGHQALYIPRRAQLHADSQELHIASRGFAASTDALLGAADASLAAALLSELSLLRGCSSKWQREAGRDGENHAVASSYYDGYLQALPSPNSMPRAAWLWDPAELESAGSAVLARDAEELRRQIDAEFNVLTESQATQLASGEHATEQLWRYARALVMSRSFRVCGGGLAMIPGIDIANTRRGAPFGMFYYCSKGLAMASFSSTGRLSIASTGVGVLWCDRDVVPGDELFNCYGQESNHELLLQHGFAL